MMRNMIKLGLQLLVGNHRQLIRPSSSAYSTYGRYTLGDKVADSRTYTQDELKQFAILTGDNNPLHLDPQFASTTRFGKPVVQGILTMG